MPVIVNARKVFCLLTPHGWLGVKSRQAGFAAVGRGACKWPCGTFHSSCEVSYQGEGALDAGGPFRDYLTAVTEDLSVCGLSALHQGADPRVKFGSL